MALINARSVCKKTFILRDSFVSHDLDFLFITDTWMKCGDNMALTELCPMHCDFVSAPRMSSQGGGLAAVLSKQFICCSVDIGEFNAFEVYSTCSGLV